MDAIILAAGEGRRLRPLTLSTPKALLKVNGSPLLGWHINNLAQIDVETIHIVVGYKSWDIEAFVQKRQFTRPSIVLHYQEEIGSSERAIHLAMSHVHGDVVLCICADDLISVGRIALLRKTVTSSIDAAFIIKRVSAPPVRGVRLDTAHRIIGCSDDPIDPILIYDFIIRIDFYQSLLSRLESLEQPLVELLAPTFATNHLVGIPSDDLLTINTHDDLRRAEEWCQLHEGC